MACRRLPQFEDRGPILSAWITRGQGPGRASRRGARSPLRGRARSSRRCRSRVVSPVRVSGEPEPPERESWPSSASGESSSDLPLRMSSQLPPHSRSFLATPSGVSSPSLTTRRPQRCRCGPRRWWSSAYGSAPATLSLASRTGAWSLGPTLGVRLPAGLSTPSRRTQPETVWRLTFAWMAACGHERSQAIGARSRPGADDRNRGRTRAACRRRGPLVIVLAARVPDTGAQRVPTRRRTSHRPQAHRVAQTPRPASRRVPGPGQQRPQHPRPSDDPCRHDRTRAPTARAPRRTTTRRQPRRHCHSTVVLQRGSAGRTGRSCASASGAARGSGTPGAWRRARRARPRRPRPARATSRCRPGARPGGRRRRPPSRCSGGHGDRRARSAARIRPTCWLCRSVARWPPDPR
jgi:hypothetical protein